MLLFTPSKPLRDRFLRIFGPSRPPKPRISLDRVDVFEVFTIFSSHSLFALSSGLLRPIFGSSGHLLASSRAHFSWPKMEREISLPPFWRTYVQVRLRPPKCCPRSLQNDPKTSPNQHQNTPQRPQITCPPSYFIVITPSYFSTTHSYLQNTKFTTY